MIYTISSDRLTIAISSLGGELQSIRSNDGTEYLGQGNPEFWKGRATNIFPYVGRTTGGKYTYHGQSYEIPIHGFIKLTEMQLVEQTPARLLLATESNEESLKLYPMPFRYELAYALDGNALTITYRVINPSNGAIVFGIGGHPGFNLPLDEGLAFEDYVLEFDRPAQPVRIGMSATCFVDSTESPFPLAGGTTLPLEHSLFDNDAIVLNEMAPGVTLRSDKGNKFVRVDYPQMTYLGLWHAPKKEAPYVCIEPWASLPSRHELVEDIETQPNIVTLPAGQTYENVWSIVCG